MKTALKDIQDRIVASYGEALTRVPETGAAVWASYKSLPPVKKVLATALIAGAVGAMMGPAILMGSASAITIQMVGLGGFILGQMAVQNKDHRHILAMLTLSTGVMTGQCIANGDIAGAAMVGHAAAFIALCAAFPDEGYKKTRHALTWAMGAGGAGLALIFAGSASGKALQGAPVLVQQAVDAIPTATVLLNAYAFSRPDRETARARLVYIFCNMAHLAYFATRENPSAGIILTEAFFLANNPVAAYRFDLIKTDLDGKVLPLSRRLATYFRNTIWRGEGRSDHGLTPDDLAARHKVAHSPSSAQIS